MCLLAHFPLKRESGGGFEGCPRAVSLRLKPPLALIVIMMVEIGRNDFSVYKTHYKELIFKKL